MENELLAGAIQVLFSDLAVARRGEHSLAVVPEPGDRYAILADDELAARDLALDEVLRMLCWFVNQGVISHGGDLLLFHAAVVSSADLGVLVVAPSGSGKSTIAASLVASGLGYLSDEVGALDPGSMRLLAYPKPISLDAASRAVLGIEDRVPAALAALSPLHGEIPASAISPGCVRSEVGPRFAVFPRLALHEDSQLRPLRPAEAMRHLVANSFNLTKRPETLFAACAELCRRVDSFELVVGDLHTARDLVSELLAGAGEEPRRCRPPELLTRPRRSQADAARPRPREDVLQAELDGELVLFDPAVDRLVLLNRSAALVWCCCDGVTRPQEIAIDVAEAFAADETTVRGQIVELFGEWARLGLLDGQAPP